MTEFIQKNNPTKLQTLPDGINIKILAGENTPTEMSGFELSLAIFYEVSEISQKQYQRLLETLLLLKKVNELESLPTMLDILNNHLHSHPSTYTIYSKTILVPADQQLVCTTKDALKKDDEMFFLDPVDMVQYIALNHIALKYPSKTHKI